MGFNPGKWLRELFRQQTKNIPTIILWTVIYILDVVFVFWIAGMIGIDILSAGYQLSSILVGAYLIAAFFLFWMEAAVWNRIRG